MGDKSRIERTDASWTPIRARYWEIQNDGSGKERLGWHCEHASEGCRNCYAESMNRRLGTGFDFKPGNLFREEKRGYNNGEAKLFLDEKMLLQPLRWRRPRTVFVCSMTDLFADFVPDEWIDRVFAVMAMTPQHTFQVLTKRSARMRAYFARKTVPHHEPEWDDGPLAPSESAILLQMVHLAGRIDGGYTFTTPILPLDNVWLGVSAERQQEADARIPDLLATPAAVRFVSAEPLLGPIDLTNINGKVPEYGTAKAHGIDALSPHNRVLRPQLDWVIVGGESGPGARPMHPDWARSLRDQCQAAGTAFFFKQWGEWREPLDGEIYDTSNGRAQKRPAYIVTPDGNVHCFHGEHTVGGVPMIRVGKKSAGRVLPEAGKNGADGRTWDEMPACAQRQSNTGLPSVGQAEEIV